MLPLRDNVPRRRTAWLTGALLLVNGSVFVYQLSLPTEQLVGLFERYGVVPARYTEGPSRLGSVQAARGPAAAP